MVDREVYPGGADRCPTKAISLMVAVQNGDFGAQGLSTARFMLLLVSFENGFFWKEYFDNRAIQRGRQEVRDR